MSSIFTKIINRDIPAYIVYEDDNVLAFLDILPMQLGHTLLVSKVEVDNWLEITLENYLAMQSVAQNIGRAIFKSTEDTPNFERIGQLVDGRMVPHFHLHLIPLYQGQEITHNEKKRKSFTVTQMQEIQTKIINNLATI